MMHSNLPTLEVRWTELKSEVEKEIMNRLLASNSLRNARIESNGDPAIGEAEDLGTIAVLPSRQEANPDLIAKLHQLLQECVDAGAEIADPVDRTQLQWLARQM